MGLVALYYNEKGEVIKERPLPFRGEEGFNAKDVKEPEPAAVVVPVVEKKAAKKAAVVK